MIVAAGRSGLIVVGITLGCGGEKAAAPTSGSGSDVAVPAKAPIAAPTRPVLADPGPQPSADATFSAQIRDDDWAPGTESQIRERFKKVRGAKLDSTECRTDRCKLVIAGSEGEVSQAIADLEGNRGLHGFATNLLLTAPEKKADGTLVLRAFATFKR
jgi:hypothetical protein